MGGIILAHVRHVVEVSERVVDGDTIHFAELKVALVTRHPIQPSLFIPTFTTLSRDVAGTVAEDASVCRVGRSRISFAH